MPIEPYQQTALADATLAVPGMCLIVGWTAMLYMATAVRSVRGLSSLYATSFNPSVHAGVVAAGVPGAGGYDALFAVILDAPLSNRNTSSALESAESSAQQTASTRSAVERVWLEWPGGGLTPLLLRDGPAIGQEGAGLVITLA